MQVGPQAGSGPALADPSVEKGEKKFRKGKSPVHRDKNEPTNARMHKKKASQ